MSSPVFIKPGPLGELETLSAELARDPLLVQAGGGNTSVKIGGQMWVKASGCWLGDAGVRPIFIAVDRAGGVANSAQAPGMRPSIETALHLALPHRFVVHLHSVNAAATSILADGAARFAAATRHGPRARALPYARPGPELARLLRAELAAFPDTEAVLLQNHGLVVGADSIRRVAQLVHQIEASLEPASLHSGGVGPPTAAPQGYSVVCHADAHLARLLSLPLFPDQVVFLLDELEVLPEQASIQPDPERPRAILLAIGRGLFVRDSATPGQRAILDWMVEVARRIPAAADLSILSAEEVTALLGWEAEHHRRNADRIRPE